MLKQRSLFVLALALALCAPARYSRAADWEINQSTYYLTAKQQQFPKFPPPPVAGSKTDLADLATLHEWQTKRTKEQCDRAVVQAHAEYETFFGGISPFPDPMPAGITEILKRVKAETDGIVGGIKDKYKRPRPFHRDASLDPCLGKVGGLSYPSGHATVSRVFALILSDLDPEHRAQFMARADEAALNRVIGGVHHPSDIEAGKKLGDMIYKLYLKSPAFRADMKILRGLMLPVPAGSAK